MAFPHKALILFPHQCHATTTWSYLGSQTDFLLVWLLYSSNDKKHCCLQSESWWGLGVSLFVCWDCWPHCTSQSSWGDFTDHLLWEMDHSFFSQFHNPHFKNGLAWFFLLISTTCIKKMAPTASQHQWIITASNHCSQMEVLKHFSQACEMQKAASLILPARWKGQQVSLSW